MTEHTPGPWRLSRTRQYVMDGLGAPWICTVQQRPGWEANAALIVRAPDLLAENEALKAEIVRLNNALRDEQNRAGRIGTHGPDCHLWGHQHYECLMRRYSQAWEALEPFAEFVDSMPPMSGYPALELIGADGLRRKVDREDFMAAHEMLFGPPAKDADR